MQVGSSTTGGWYSLRSVTPGTQEERELKEAAARGEAIKLEQADEQEKKKTDTESTEDKADDEFNSRLKARDLEVRQHEAAHLAAAGGLATGGASYTFQTGEDGQSYAVGGHVDIDISKESTPEATLAKMQRVMTAAKAPASPSTQDIKVAAQAAQIMQEARQELAEKHQQERDGENRVSSAYKSYSDTSTFSAIA